MSADYNTTQRNDYERLAPSVDLPVEPNTAALLLLLTRRLAWRLVQKLQGHVTHKKDDVFGRQRKKQEGQQRHQYEVANKYVFKCRLKVDSDDDDVTNDGKLFHARALVLFVKCLCCIVVYKSMVIDY